MFTKLNRVIQRLEWRAGCKDRACQQVQQQADGLQSDIRAARQQRQQMQQHLNTLQLSGATTLASLLAFRGQQATIQRRLAEAELQLTDQQQQHEQLMQQLGSLRAERNQLHRKREKLTQHTQRWRQQQRQEMQRRQDTESEEQRHWQI